MSSEFLRCNNLELIYCNKRGPVIFYHLHPPPQKSVSSKTKKTGPGFANTHHLAWYFCFLHILPSSTHQEDVLHAQRLPTFEALWRREWRIDVAVIFFFFGHQQLDGQRKTLRKNWACLSSHLPPFHQLKKNTTFFKSFPFKSFLWTCFFRHLFIGHPNKPKGSQLSTLPQETLSPDEAEALMSAIDAWSSSRGILPREILGKSLATHFF